MTFNLHTNLFRHLFKNSLFKGLICGIVTLILRVSKRDEQSEL